MLELFMSFNHRDLSGWSGCGKNQCCVGRAESFLRGDEQTLQQGPGSLCWKSDSLGTGHGSIPRTFVLGNWVWGKTPEVRGVGLGSSSLHGAGCHAVYSGPSWGKEDGEREG